MKKILGWLVCHILHDHDWTCKATEGIKPGSLVDMSREEILVAFGEYNKMYCKRCRKVYYDRI